MTAGDLKKIADALNKISEADASEAMAWLTVGPRPVVPVGRTVMAASPVAGFYGPWAQSGGTQVGGFTNNNINSIADVWESILAISERHLEQRNKKLSANSKAAINNKISAFRNTEAELKHIHDTLRKYSSIIEDNQPDVKDVADIEKLLNNLNTKELMTNKMRVRLHSILNTLYEAMQA